MNTEFQWSTESAKELCEYVGLRVAKNGDIKQQIDLLTSDFIASKTKPKEYEILRFNREGRELYLTNMNRYDSLLPNENGWYVGTLEQLLEEKATIVKVKRISDGEEFSIGEVTQSGKITGFLIQDDLIFALFEGNSRRCLLAVVKKAKPILFTTDDGVAIKEGDCYHAVQKNTFHSIRCNYKLDKPHEWVTFSTPEKALEYINLHKVRFSLKDVHEAMFLSVNQTLEGAFDILKNKSINT